MKNVLLLLVISFLILGSIPFYAQAIPNDSLYLGQTPPGNTPKIFNLSASNGLRPVERIAVTSDGKEIYYGELNTWPPTNQRIKCYKYLDNKWQGPFVVFEGYIGPGLADNDSTMYMEKNVNNIPCTYFSIRNASGWSTPTRLLSTNETTHYYQKTDQNNFYLSSTSSGSSDICKLINTNSAPQIQSLGKPINTVDTENDFFVARDESFLIFIRFGSSTASDMYISYKKDNESWTNPKKFGAPINTSDPNWECCPYVSNDNKYLFFTRGGNSMSSYYTYWVKIDNTIDSLRTTNFLTYLKNIVSTQSIPAGQSFSFTLPDSTIIDDDGNHTLTYSATQVNGTTLPSWLTFDPATQTFSGTPTAVGNISVKVTAKDPTNASANCIFNINVTTATGLEDNKDEIPTSINLFQNYPNPFNPSTIIEFAIPESGRYTLSLYNTLGELVEVIADKEYQTGYHKEVFNAKGLSSGLYFYSLTGNYTNIVRKMMLLR